MCQTHYYHGHHLFIIRGLWWCHQWSGLRWVVKVMKVMYLEVMCEEHDVYSEKHCSLKLCSLQKYVCLSISLTSYDRS